MDDRQHPIGAEVRVGVVIGRRAVGRPTRVPNAGLTAKRSILQPFMKPVESPRCLQHFQAAFRSCQGHP